MGAVVLNVVLHNLAGVISLSGMHVWGLLESVAFSAEDDKVSFAKITKLDHRIFAI